MKFLFLLLLSLSAFANSDMDYLEQVVRDNHSGEKSFFMSPDVNGSQIVSKDMSMNEMLSTIEMCKQNETLKTASEEGDGFKSVSFSCKVGKEIVVTESMIEEETITSFQEMRFEERLIDPQVYYKLLQNSEIEKVSTKDYATTGLKTLGTFARIGIPVLLAFKTSKILAPDRIDWQKHFIAGSIVSGVTILTAQGIMKFIAKKRGVEISERKAVVIASMAGFLMSVVVGGAKEFRDQRGFGTPEFRDAVFTAAGGAMVSIFYAIPFGRIFGWRPAPVTVPYRSEAY